MRFSARLLLICFSFSLLLTTFVVPVSAQTVTPTQAPANYNDFRTPNVDSSVPRNNHSYTQAVMIDVLSAIVCQLTGIDPTNKAAGCLGVNPQTGQIGVVPTQMNQMGQASPQVGGAVSIASGLIGGLYVQSVSSTQYYHYLASNFGIVKSALAQTATNQPTGQTCISNQFGYGFCGLTPIFNLWKAVRDMSYGLLTLVFVVLGIGVMVRFKVDPRTVMTLQNQIPRVIVSILLITFSYAIAGAMIDLMWTVTYAGISIISNASPNSKIALSCATDGTNGTEQTVEKPISSAGQLVMNQPISFANTLFLSKCNTESTFGTDGGINGGILHISAKVSDSVRGLVTSLLNSLFGWNPDDASCDGVISTITSPISCLSQAGLFITQLIVIAIIVIAILIALFRLWFELLKTYITILVFIIMGPIWIIFGLIPGRPLGFEKWLRIMFANLAAFPLVAFMLVFGRVMMDGATPNPDPGSVFIPPLIGNPNVTAFNTLMGLGAIMLAPTIPGTVKERMKAKGSGNYGKTIAAGLAIGASVGTAPGKKVWESLNHKNPTTGSPEGALAVWKHQQWKKSALGRRAIARKEAAYATKAGGNYKQERRTIMQRMKSDKIEAKRDNLLRKTGQATNPEGEYIGEQTRMNRATSELLSRTPFARQGRANRLNRRVQQRNTNQQTRSTSSENRANRAAANQSEYQRLRDAIRDANNPQGGNSGNNGNNGTGGQNTGGGTGTP